MLSLLSEVNAAVWEQLCKTIIQKYFDRLCSGISEWPKQHFRCCERVILSHSAKSHYFFMRLEEFIRKMHFHLLLFALTLFRTIQKPPQKMFGDLRDFYYSKFCVSIIHIVQQMYTYTSCTLTTLHCSKVSFLQCSWKDIITYLQKCEGCTHFCQILYINIYIMSVKKKLSNRK